MSDEQEWWHPSVLDRGRLGSIVEAALERVATACGRQAFPPGLLIVGPQGLGRELVASEAAALLTCPDGGGVWCSCHSCDRVRRGRHPDVVKVQPQGTSQQIKIEQVRQVVEAVPGRPFEGRHRVWLFDGVESGRLGAEAANAFLKTLEEPPVHAAFLLLAANPSAVLPTVRSRCQQLVLPGAVAVASSFGVTGCPPELACDDTDRVQELSRLAADVLRSADGGEVLPLLRLARSVADEAVAFQVLSAVALETAAGSAHGDQAEDLVRLASELLRAERTTRALNLNRERQLLSCLLRWRREGRHGGHADE